MQIKNSGYKSYHSLQEEYLISLCLLLSIYPDLRTEVLETYPRIIVVINF